MDSVSGMIPALDSNGLLPPGEWDCALSEVARRFATNPHRQALWDGLLRFLDSEARPLGAPTLWIDGSFTRSKPFPDDIDLVLDLSTWEADKAKLAAYSLYLRRSSIKAEYGLDVYARHPDLPYDLAAFFQYAGEKCAAELQLDRRQLKGILRVQL